MNRYCSVCGQWPTHKAGCSEQISFSSNSVSEKYEAALMKAGHQIQNLQDQVEEMSGLEEEVGRQAAVIRGLNFEIDRLKENMK